MAARTRNYELKKSRHHLPNFFNHLKFLWHKKSIFCFKIEFSRSFCRPEQQHHSPPPSCSHCSSLGYGVTVLRWGEHTQNNSGQGYQHTLTHSKTIMTPLIQQ
jgi:hypothetical protein